MWCDFLIILSCSQEIGLKELLKGYQLETSVRRSLCAMVLLGYHLLVVYVLGNADGDLVQASAILDDQLKVNIFLHISYLGRNSNTWFECSDGRPVGGLVEIKMTLTGIFCLKERKKKVCNNYGTLSRVLETVRYFYGFHFVFKAFVWVVMNCKVFFFMVHPVFCLPRKNFLLWFGFINHPFVVIY